jgi:transposase InsO family protein
VGDGAPSPRSKNESVPELEQARREIERLQRELERVERERDRLRQQNERLKQQLDAARRAGFRQAAPFAKPLPREPKRPGRKAGRAYGRAAQRPMPPHVDETHDAPLPARCPGCGDRVIEMRVATQSQEELPVACVVVRQFHVHIGQCRRCGRRVQGRHPLQTSDALGAAAAQLGAHAVAFAVVLNKQLGLSFGRFREECLNEHWFTSLAHAQAVIETWRREYNEERPKKSLGGLTPALYAKKLATEQSTVTAGL